MTEPQTLSTFVRDALVSGQTRDGIKAALLRADWAEREVEDALNAWKEDAIFGIVPRATRQSSAMDAFFYALLFVAFGMIAGNFLVLAFGQIERWLPDPDARIYIRSALSSQRWSIAALIVFVPAFFWLDRFDIRATQQNAARQHGTIRRWLSAIAMFIAVVALMGDALSLIYNFLDGQLTARFLAKSATVALVALLVLVYFYSDRQLHLRAYRQRASWTLILLCLLSIVATLITIGGPLQGQKERRDRLRYEDMETLSRDILRCRSIDTNNLPEALSPLSCAQNPDRLTAYAADVIYERLNASTFKLCIRLESPHTRDIRRLWDAETTLVEDTLCLTRKEE